MQHYEIVFMVNADQGEQIPNMLVRYKELIANKNGIIHRLEDWGRRPLAYPIANAYKAHYILINIECGTELLNELTNSFKFNDAIIRHLVLKRNTAVTKPSPIVAPKEVKALEAEEFGEFPETSVAEKSTNE
jgi:small subunit ribosomal protein S6